MSDLAEDQIERLVSLVAWMSQADREEACSYAAAGRRLGISAALVRKDLEVLVRLTESHKPWLGSLQVALVADGFILGSLGAFRRPLRLTGDEALAIVLGLLQERGGKALAARLGRVIDEAPSAEEVDRLWAIGPTPGEGVAQVLALARRARDEERRLELAYCGSREERSSRVVHPYQVVQHAGRWYIIAWCEEAGAVRHFRAERVLGAALLPERFERRDGVRPVGRAPDLFAGQAELSAVVAFSPRIRRWVEERYPHGAGHADGRYVVRFPVADPRWLAREVLQYGAEAEVLEPEAVRRQMREMVG